MAKRDGRMRNDFVEVLWDATDTHTHCGYSIHKVHWNRSEQIFEQGIGDCVAIPSKKYTTYVLYVLFCMVV